MLDLTALKPFLELVGAGALTTALIFILYGGAKKEPWWVFAWVYREALKLRDEQIVALVKDRDDRLLKQAEDYNHRLREQCDEYEKRLIDQKEELIVYRDIAMKTTTVSERIVDSAAKR